MLKYNYLIVAKCPHCGYENKYNADNLENGKHAFVTCDCDDAPGCGKQFIIRVDLTYTVSVCIMYEVKS